MRLALRIFLVVLFGAAYWQAMRGRGFDLAADYETILKDVVGTGFWLAVASFCTELLRMFIMRQARRQGFASRMPRLLFDIGGIVIFFCAGLVIVSQVFGLELSGLLFTSGIIAAAAGFALQPTATDLIAGISLNFREGTIKIGDWVQVANGVVGKVTQITWSDTHLVTLDDRMIVVRNSKLVELQLMNYSAPQRPYQNKLKITVGFEAPPDRVSAILVTAMKAVPNLVPNPEPYVIIEEFSENGVPYSMYFHVPDYPEAQFITNQVAVNALKFLDQAGFAPAYPKREHFDGREARTQRGIERRIDINAILRRVPLFDSFGAEEIAELAGAVALQQFKPGAVVVREGDDGKSLFVVVSGLLDVFKQMEGGDQRKVGMLSPGNVFGEWSLLTGAARSATVTAAVDTGLIEIDKARLEPILTRYPETLAELSRIEAERSANNVNVMSFTPAERQEIAKVGMASFLRGKIMRFFSVADRG
ncbi:MAG TPA: mechanosensitive ion channel family protein [Stellaceae bacterium]|jgi:small-conductance mechanosensitive channel/CRP-like cAMP-binding protein